MSLQEEIIAQLGVKPIIDPEEEIRKSVDFLKAYLKKHPFLKSYVLGISGGQDSTLAGRLAQLAVEEMRAETGELRNTIKLSNNAEKVSTPGKKQVWRITSREKGKSEGDYITYDGIDVNSLEELEMFHPTYTYINKRVKNFDAVPLLVDIFQEGNLVYSHPSLTEIQAYARKEFDKLWDEYKRVLNPQDYPVDLARDIWQDKMDLIDQMRKKAYQTGAEK